MSRSPRGMPVEPPAERTGLGDLIAERREAVLARLGRTPAELLESTFPGLSRDAAESPVMRGVDPSSLGATRHHPGGRSPMLALSARWSWLEDSYWIVPPANLPAILYSPTTETVLPVSDQTVFHITGYEAGYFWGISVAQFGGGTPGSSSMIGSVTPEGRVLINFTVQGESDSPTYIQGIGQMRRQYGQWTMENQMVSTPSNQAQIGHWAYMVRTRPGLPSWESLPGVGVSVPEFLGPFEGTGPRPFV